MFTRGMALTNSRSDTHRDLPGHTPEDRVRIRDEAHAEMVADVDAGELAPAVLERWESRNGWNAA